tara:strand:+ start:908 stop:1744 length:837 start_codon:yes stop_codon:yes gene_type:complete
LNKPTIYCNYLSRFANNIFQYCYAHLLNQKIGGSIKFSECCTLDSGPTHDEPSNWEGLESKPIYEITNSTHKFSTKEQMGKFRPGEIEELSHKYEFNPPLESSDFTKDIILSDYFQNYQYYKNHKSLIRSLLYKLYQRQLDEYPSPKDVVAHYRGTDIHLQVPPEYYIQILKNEEYDKFYIVTEDPNNPRVQYLRNSINSQKPNSVIIRSSSVVDDFLFLLHANRIIMSVSTFAWMSAWLSDARKIYFPIDNYLYSKRGDKRLIVDDEPRYIYTNLFQ